MNKKLHIFIIIILAIIFIGVGIIIGNNSCSSINNTDDTPCISQNEIQKQIMTDLKQKFDSKTEENLIPFVLSGDSEEMFLSGRINSLQHDTINVKVKNIFKSDDLFSYLNEPNFYIKTIKISDETEIIKQETKDTEEFDGEIEKFNTGQTEFPPLPFKEVPMRIEDLQKNTEVSVEAETVINLKGSEIIGAKKIIITTDGNNDNNY